MALSREITLTIDNYNITLDKEIKIYEYDAINLCFTIQEYGIVMRDGKAHNRIMPVVALKAYMLIETPQGTDSVEATNIVRNKIIFSLGNKYSQFVGVGKMQIILRDLDGCRITLPEFTYEVKQSINTDWEMPDVLVGEKDFVVTDELGRPVETTKISEMDEVNEVTPQTYTVVINEDGNKKIKLDTIMESISETNVEEIDRRIDEMIEVYDEEEIEVEFPSLHNDVERIKGEINEISEQLDNLTNLPIGLTNGVDDTELIQNAYNIAKNTTKQLYIPSNRSYVITGLTIDTDGFKIFGGGSLRHKNNSTTPLLSINAQRVTIDGITFDGTYVDNDINNNNDIGISIVGDSEIEGKDRHIISNCRFHGFMKGGLYTKNIYNSNSTIQITNCNFYGNKVGYFSDIYGEYVTFSNCHFVKNTNGVWLHGGNNVFVGCTLDQNVNAIMLMKGTNDGHGIFSGCNINHNTQYGVYIEELQTGFTFDSCHIFESPIGVIKNRAGFSIVFNNCMLDPKSMIGEYADVTFINNRFINSYLSDINNINFKFNNHESVILAQGNTFSNPLIFMQPYTLEGSKSRYSIENNITLNSSELINFNKKIVNNTPFIQDSGTAYVNGTLISKLSRNPKKTKINCLIKFTLNDGAMLHSNTLIKLVKGASSEIIADFTISRYNEICYFANLTWEGYLDFSDTLSIKVFPPSEKTLTILADETYIEVLNL